ncbi:hypothetical protein MUSASHINO07_01130 [Gemella sp. Musashino-2025]
MDMLEYQLKTKILKGSWSQWKSRIYKKIIYLLIKFRGKILIEKVINVLLEN